MDEYNSATLKATDTARREGINPLYLVTSKSENSTLSRLGASDVTKSNNTTSAGNGGVSSSSVIERLTTNLDKLDMTDKIELKKQPYLSRTLRAPSSLSSCKMQKPRSVPPKNVPEKIVFCIDISSEMWKHCFVSESGEKQSFIQCVKKAVKIFIRNKSIINSFHEYAIIFLTNTALWMLDFTSSEEKLYSVLDEIPESSVDDSFELTDIFDSLHAVDHKTLSASTKSSCTPQLSYRLILLYGRSQCIPHLNLCPQHSFWQSNECCTVDVIYLYPSSDVQEAVHETIFSTLGDLDFNGLSYIFAVDSYTQMFNCCAKLLGHPFQRPLQHMAHHILED